MWPYGVLWLLWGLAFLGIEGSALLDEGRHPGRTLSEIVWAWAGVRSGRWTWKRWLLLAALAWLTLHLAFGWLSL